MYALPHYCDAVEELMVLQAIMDRCIFHDNRAFEGGGAYFAFTARATVERGIFLYERVLFVDGAA